MNEKGFIPEESNIENRCDSSKQQIIHPSEPSELIGSERHGDDFKVLRNTPVFKWTVITAFISAIVGGVYFELQWFVSILPPGILPLRNYVGLLFFALLALLCVSVSGAVLYQGMKNRNWNDNESVVFYGGIVLALIFLLTGMQFFLFEIFDGGNIFMFYFVKLGNLLLLIGFLAYAVRLEFKRKNKEIRR